MKKIIFSGRLTNDKQMFIEISICSYGYKVDGEKISLPYVVGIANDVHDIVEMTIIKQAVDLVNFVKFYGFNKADIDKLIKGIKRNGADLVLLFGANELSTLIKDLKEIAKQDK